MIFGFLMQFLFDIKGHGAVLNKNTKLITPTQVTTFGLKKIIDIAAGSSFTIALTESKDIYSFGSNSKGQLGLGAKIKQELSPKKIDIDTKFESIFAAYSHCFAISLSGELFSWGRGSNYQVKRNIYLKSPSKKNRFKFWMQLEFKCDYLFFFFL